MANEKRLVDANALVAEIKETVCKNCNSHNGIRCGSCWVDDTIGFLRDSPTVDAVEVVRCKDCIGKAHWYTNDYGCTICGVSGLFVVEDKDFCSYGERKDNG